MKKKLFFLLLIILVMSMILMGVLSQSEKKYKRLKSGNPSWKVYDTFSEAQEIELPVARGMIGYYIDEGYLIATFDKGRIKMIGVLSPKREWIYLSGPSPINFNAQLEFEKMTFSDIEALYGKDWIDTGNNFSFLTYITVDGKIIQIYVIGKSIDEGKIIEIWETDIITGNNRLIYKYT